MKRKPSVKVLDNNVVAGYCPCTWTGTRLSGKTDLMVAYGAAMAEAEVHVCIPQPKKPRKKRVKK